VLYKERPLQPNMKTKSTDFLPNKPSMDGLNQAPPKNDVAPSGQKAEFVPPKPSAHIIDLKANDAPKNKPTIDMVSNSTTKQEPSPIHEPAKNVTYEEQNVEQNHTPQNEVIKPKKSSKVKWVLIILGFVILLGVAVVGGIYLASKSTSSGSNSNSTNMNM